ncbi:prephenate dehydratase [Amycolatopsis methanolica]|uniref:Prephenate dehydratase n=2 Tax=Amycolatopsis methanolica TaxID=1814 RepID=PHEA_AMYME|nr:prephenate dehydratase [Amycolatopsis methanolica]Q44104.1 RecName: Full=Prephenate dehydratase; Short=PDT [Amycolatopsis methanolica]AAA88840.1 prephenate dehydratase [Amycolatopsis methanolica]AIJ20295.1 Prephenate dehydratase [Amycolatopsis methanolica 239]
MSRIAYFGPVGTFTEQAARTFMAAGDELVAAETIPKALDAVRRGEADAACVPVENSVEGAVPATLDSLAVGEPLIGVAEALLPVHFSVLTRDDVGEIRTVASHPHALAQVRKWLEDNLPGARVVAAGSTAAAAVAVQAGEFDAAVTAPVAVEHYPLKVLATEVADVRDARTRFLLMRRPPVVLPEPTGADRTSIVAAAANRTGTLAELLTELATRGINLTRLDARPHKQNFGEYRFFIDFEGHVAEPRIADALAALRRRCRDVRFLGSFARADGVAATIEPAARNEDFTDAADWVAAVQRGEQA